MTAKILNLSAAELIKSFPYTCKIVIFPEINQIIQDIDPRFTSVPDIFHIASFSLKTEIKSNNFLF